MLRTGVPYDNYMNLNPANNQAPSPNLISPRRFGSCRPRQVFFDTPFLSSPNRAYSLPRVLIKLTASAVLFLALTRVKRVFFSMLRCRAKGVLTCVQSHPFRNGPTNDGCTRCRERPLRSETPHIETKKKNESN